MNLHKLRLFRYLRGDTRILTGILVGVVTFCVVLTGKYLGHPGYTGIVDRDALDSYTAALVAGVRNVQEVFFGQAAEPGLRGNPAGDSTADISAATILHGAAGYMATPASSDEKTTVSRGSRNQNPPRQASATRSTAPATSDSDSAATDVELTHTGGVIGQAIDAGSSTLPTPGYSEFTPAASMQLADGSRDTDIAGLDPAAILPSADNGNTVPPVAGQPWATPDCPVELPQGSTAADAETMLIQYGCRYLLYCRLLNDGSDAGLCWYGFYSAPRFNG